MIDVPVLSIDVSKSKSVAALVKSYQESVSKPFPFLHSPSDMSRLTDKLIQLESETGKRPHVVMEATGTIQSLLPLTFKMLAIK